MDGTWMQKDYHDVTTLHPLGLAMLVVLGVAMLVLPRRQAILPMLILACFVAGAQRLVVLTLDFTLLRLMVLFGFARIMLRNETRGVRWKTMDTAIILYVVSATLTFVTLYGGELGKFIFKAGNAFDALGMYFIGRCLIRDFEDVKRLGLYAAYLSVPVAIFFAIEHATGRNVFAIFGGVAPITKIRDGRLRCQGAFAHPILAGTFWAVLLPLIASLWWQDARSRMWAMLGICSSLVIIIACASSTPVMAVGVAVMGACFFPMRHQMRLVRWGLVFMLIFLHFAREKPVWHLLSRVTVVGGSTGYHRYRLVDAAINHLNEWWLLGVKSNAHWGFGLDDVTNQYVLEGIRGGLVTLALFIAMIVIGFKGVGRLWRLAERDTRCLALAWALGVVLLVHTIGFLAISYFGQINLLWYVTLGAIASMTPAAARALQQPRAVRRGVARPSPARAQPGHAPT